MVEADVRRPRIVASVALIATFAVVAVPGPSGPRATSPFDASSIDLVSAARPETETDVRVRGPMTIEPLDPGARSDGSLDHDSTLLEPSQPTEPPTARPGAAQPTPETGTVRRNRWRHDAEASWYGPGFIGNGTACGQILTRSLVGVAHRTLPCGTLIAFRNPENGRVVVAPVVDRGPFVSGRRWDLTYGLCKQLDHCYTGPIDWRYGPRD